MNKRQKKKQFKKRYGINPDKAVTLFMENWPSIIDKVKSITETMVKIIKEFPDKLRNMPEEEFNSIINGPDITIEQKALAIRIRKGTREAKEEEPID
jgi:hypothetical protein